MAVRNRRLLTRVLGGSSKKLTPAFANEVLEWQFTDAERRRAAVLADKNNRNALNRDEMEELDMLVVLSDILDILHARAKQTLKSKRPQRVA